MRRDGHLRKRVHSVWRANHDITLDLLKLCPDDAFEFKPGSGKTIRSNFVHIVSVRRMALEDKARSRADSVPKLDWKTATRTEITEALELSSSTLVAAFEERFVPGTKKSWPPTLLLNYLVAHEAHHRSQIEITLRVNGRDLSDAESYSLWEWTKKFKSHFES